MRPDESPSRDVREAVERLRQRTLGLGERRGWFAPRPAHKPEVWQLPPGTNWAARPDRQARREVEELEALARLEDPR
jgi:hypothetical protein